MWKYLVMAFIGMLVVGLLWQAYGLAIARLFAELLAHSMGG